MTQHDNNVTISITNADVFSYEADVLVLKYAQALYGVDWQVVDRLEAVGIDMQSVLPKEDSHHLVNSMNQIAARTILFVGVKDLFHFRYQEIREFARRSLSVLAKEAPETKNICFTMHGANYGLDEIEAFESEIAGLTDALSEGSYPEKLQWITIVERKRERYERLQNILSELLPKGFFEKTPEFKVNDKIHAANERLRSAGYSSDSKPHIFVAMPFVEEMEDIYDYGIRSAVNAAGFICERADLSTFTGEILEWIKKRIKTSTLVVADLTNANPNVYLEVGYAWGCGIPTVLLVRDPKELKFDVQGHRCLIYKRIKELEDLLNKELRGLRATMAI